jgi:hypothetical protein
LPEEQVVRLERAAECRNASIADLLKIRRIDLFEDPADPFGPGWARLREREQELMCRLA